MGYKAALRGFYFCNAAPLTSIKMRFFIYVIKDHEEQTLKPSNVALLPINNIKKAEKYLPVSSGVAPPVFLDVLFNFILNVFS